MTDLKELTEDERQTLLRLIDRQTITLSGRRATVEYSMLVALRRKLEGVDKRVLVETMT